jgi:hypothetical protein
MASNRRWRLPFRYRGSRRESAVAQLFSLGHSIMRTFIILFLFTTAAFAGDTNAFCPYILWPPTNSPPFQGYNWTNNPKLIDSSKATTITNGITLGQVVTNLGPGQLFRFSGVCDISWCFTDGCVLHVWPQECLAKEVLHTNKGMLWFTTNSYVRSPKSPEPL